MPNKHLEKKKKKQNHQQQESENYKPKGIQLSISDNYISILRLVTQVTITSNNKGVKHLELTHCSWEGKNFTAVLEKSLTFSYKVKYILTI